MRRIDKVVCRLIFAVAVGQKFAAVIQVGTLQHFAVQRLRVAAPQPCGRLQQGDFVEKLGTVRHLVSYRPAYVNA